MRIPSLIASAAALMVLAGCGSATSTDEASDASGLTTKSSPNTSAKGGGDNSEQQSPAAQTGAGSFIDWADYDADPAAYGDTRVVLEFHADWCPDCRATEESLNTVGVPDGLTVVKVDFDNSDELRQKYGVTVQHTFVYIDADGNELKKWTGTHTGEEILEQTA
jgi:thiol-disulfide isomerase/thioredoxin